MKLVVIRTNATATLLVLGSLRMLDSFLHQHWLLHHLNADDSDDDYSAWYVGLEWSMCSSKATPSVVPSVNAPNSDGDDDKARIWEFFYKFVITDNITVTPAILALPASQDTDKMCSAA